MEKHEQIANALLPLLGGPGNIGTLENCITRMRVTPVDRSLIQDAAIRRVPGVLGVVDAETYQIVLGPGAVTRVTDSVRAHSLPPRLRSRPVGATRPPVRPTPRHSPRRARS